MLNPFSDTNWNSISLLESKNIEALIADGYTTVKIPLYVSEIVRSLLNETTLFFSRSPEAKRKFSCEGRLGYDISNYSPKESSELMTIERFNYRCGDLRKELTAKENNFSSATAMMLTAIEGLDEFMAATTEQIGRELDKRITGINLVERIIEARAINTVRLLRYRSNGIESAKDHYDNNFLTFIFADNAQALRYGDTLEHEYRMNYGEVLVFLGTQALKVYSAFKRQFHGVRFTKEKNVIRCSIVGFAQIII